MTEKLARVHWHRGQTLLPDHLFAQEESLMADTSARFQLTGLPYYGIGRLQWNESLLAEGILSIVALTVVFPTGLLIDIPGNSNIQPFNMNVSGTTKVSIYLHVINDQLEDKITHFAQEDDSVPKIRYRLELSCEQKYPGALQTLKLAEFQKAGDGGWSLLEDLYLPPLLQVGTSPFLMAMVDYLAQLLEMFHFKLLRDVTASYLSGESLFIAKQCLQGVYELQGFFANLKGQIHYHPYHLYATLKSFYINVCLYKNCTPENVDSPYLHDQLALCIKRISEPLFKQIQLIKSKFPYMPFKREDGLYVISRLPKEIETAKEVYFLLQKPSVSSNISMEGVKLASLSRIAMVHQMALTGIPINKIDTPPFQHSFGSEVEFYLIVMGEEWDYAFGDSSIAFYDRPGWENVTPYLYWRQ